ncbi:MAG: response regulator transcription factor [Chloroflexi bacterium]|nr:response regulator transcription factor [Chloroflexota bacterium]
MLNSVNGHQDIDDFLVEPYDITELLCRIKRLLNITADNDNDELIKCGDLTIDLARYEVSVGNRPVMLTFREYELLKFLAQNRGRVFSREALLTRVWDYDYFGGDRTVDVHIRRLRSKIEDSNHAFIETVRNIGYRFKKDN